MQFLELVEEPSFYLKLINGFYAFLIIVAVAVEVDFDFAAHRRDQDSLLDGLSHKEHPHFVYFCARKNSCGMRELLVL